MADAEQSRGAEGRYYLARDNDCHWYVVPVDRSEEWEEWLSLDSDDQRSWEAPAWARAVGGSPSVVSFTDPQTP